LCVKETKNRGWWVAGGLVEPKEDFYSAAIRETKEEAGVEIELKGILRVEHSVYGYQTSRTRVIFFATSNSLETKQISDSESEGASWLTIKEIEALEKTKPGLRGPEIIDWPRYIENGGVIAPLDFLVDECQPIKLIQVKDVLNVTSTSSIDLDTFFKLSLETVDIEHIREALIRGVDPNQTINNKNWTALHYAIKIKNEYLVKLLLLSGSNPSKITWKNRNCFHFAIQSTLQILKLLLLSICDLEVTQQLKIINYQDNFLDTPLHISAKDIVLKNVNDMSIFNLIKNFGGDLHIKNKDGLTPLDIIK
jgi:ADP-ribose pyrophosphatase YjhB (NUDIX family)